MIAALQSAAVALAATLLNSLWEDALIVGIVVVLLRVLPNANASTRYAIWWTALVACLAVPIATTLPLVYANAPASSALPVSSVAASTAHTTHGAAVSRQPVVASASTVETPAVSRFAVTRPHFNVPALLAAVVVVAWLAAALIILARLGYALFQLERLKSDSLPLPVEFRDDMAAWLAAVKGGRDVRLCVSDETEVPVAVGLFDAMILIPRHLLETLAHAELDQISLHELAHLRRADDWTNGLQRVISAMLFFNPAVRYVGQQLDIEREVACDDWVVTHTGSVRPYAMCLTKMAETTAWPHRPVPAPGVFVTRKNISIRIERLLRAGRDIGTGISPAPASIAAALFIVAGFIVWSVAPSFAFDATTAKGDTTMAQIPAIKPVPTIKPIAAISPLPRTEQHLHIVIKNGIPQTGEIAPVPSVRSVPSVPSIPAIPVAAVAAARAAAAAGAHAGSAHEDIERVGCTGCNLSNADYSGKDLHGARIVGSNFDDANFSGANLSGANLTGSHFGHANFRNANLRNANLSGTSIDDVDFTGADLTGAKLTGSHFEHARFDPAQARAVIPGCAGCNFEGLAMHGVDLSGLHLMGIVFNNSDFSGANFSHAHLEGVQFNNCNLDGVKVDGAHLVGVGFPHTSTKNIDWSGASLMGVDLTEQ